MLTSMLVSDAFTHARSARRTKPRLVAGSVFGLLSLAARQVFERVQP